MDYNEVWLRQSKFQEIYLRKGVTMGLFNRSKKKLLFEEVEKFFNEGKYQEALESDNKLLEIDSKNELAWIYNGAIFEILEKYPEALESFDKALEINPKNANTWYNKGVIFGYLEKFSEALESYNTSLKYDSKI